MSDIALEGASKHYGTARAVDDVSFEAAAGSFLVLLGPSGCGKSTTLRLIAGLEEPTAGRVRIGGRDVTRDPPSSRHISMVFQSYALFPHLDVAENIVFGLKVRGVAAGERRRRLQRVAELVGLGGLLKRRPAQLSGGQRQRVALARAIIAENPVCLMDEPLSNLDAQLRHEMRVEIRALQQRLGMTVIYVTHDQIEAMSMADRIVLMRDGAVLFDCVDSARLTMREFSDRFLDDYLDMMGKAALTSVGAYQLEGVGVHLFERVTGDYFTILGLPLLPLLAYLRQNGFVAG